MEQLHAEVGAMKCALQLQGDVCANLHLITADVNRRVCTLEHAVGETQESDTLCPTDGPASSDVRVAQDGDRGAVGSISGMTQDPGAVAMPVTEAMGGAASCHKGIGCHGAHTLTSSGMGEVYDSLRTTHSPGSLKWTNVVKKGKPHLAVKMGARLNTTPGLRKPGKTVTIVGTGAASHRIKTVTTKLVSVFASRFSPDLDEETLSDYLREQLGHEVMCQKLVTSNSRFSSFKVSAECNDVAEMYKPDIWPVGAYVRRFFEPRNRAGATGSNDRQ